MVAGVSPLLTGRRQARARRPASSGRAIGPAQQAAGKDSAGVLARRGRPLAGLPRAGLPRGGPGDPRAGAGVGGTVLASPTAASVNSRPEAPRHRPTWTARMRSVWRPSAGIPRPAAEHVAAGEPEGKSGGGARLPPAPSPIAPVRKVRLNHRGVGGNRPDGAGTAGAGRGTDTRGGLHAIASAGSQDGLKIITSIRFVQGTAFHAVPDRCERHIVGRRSRSAGPGRPRRSGGVRSASAAPGHPADRRGVILQQVVARGPRPDGNSESSGSRLGGPGTVRKPSPKIHQPDDRRPGQSLKGRSAEPA